MRNIQSVTYRFLVYWCLWHGFHDFLLTEVEQCKKLNMKFVHFRYIRTVKSHQKCMGRIEVHENDRDEKRNKTERKQTKENSGHMGKRTDLV